MNDDAFEKIAKQALTISTSPDLQARLWRETVRQRPQEAEFNLKMLWRDITQFFPHAVYSLSFLFVIALFTGTQLTIADESFTYISMLQLLEDVS